MATSLLRNRTRSLVATIACTLTVSTVSTAPTASAQESIVHTLHDVLGETGSSAASIGDLASLLSSLEAEIRKLELEMGKYQELANQALVDFQNARSNAEQARLSEQKAQRELGAANFDLEDAQKLVNEVAQSRYGRAAGSSAVNALAGSDAREDALDRQAFLRQESEENSKVIAELEQVRTKKANQEASLRQARESAEEKEGAAFAARDNANAVLGDTQEKHSELGQQHSELLELQTRAQEKLEARRGVAQEPEQEDSAPATSSQPTPATFENTPTPEAEPETETSASVEETARETNQPETQGPEVSEEATLASVEPTSEVATPEDPEEQTSHAEEPAESAPASNGGGDFAELIDALNSAADIFSGAPAETENPPATASPQQPVVAADEANSPSAVADGGRAEKIEAVIARAESQIGTPYAWGGGTADGPSRGIRDGGTADSFGDYNKVGFDCSGFTLYSFAAAGINLPHFTGYQYNQGQKIDPANMERGDLIFYGPSGNQHVAIYLGNGEMIEAPQSGQTVTKTPVRWNGMAPSAVRLI